MNVLGEKNKNDIAYEIPEEPLVMLKIADCMEVLKDIPDSSIQLIVLDPPYNLKLAYWDVYDDYIAWAKEWLDECYRVLKKSGSLVIFGGTQFQGIKTGDLIEIIYYVRHYTKFNFVNSIVWYYKNGISASRFFANRHEDIIWLTKTKKYYFDLDSVRVKYDSKTEALYLKDKRLNPENVKKGKNPTNVWEISRLNGNSHERVGHLTQKPLSIIRRIVKSMSPPGEIVLDFFAGSGTTGRVCIEEKRNVILVDNDSKSRKYFSKHLENMQEGKYKFKYKETHNISDFFNE